MLKIGISQRLDKVKNREEYRDELDVEWAGILWQIGIIPIPLCSNIRDNETYIKSLNLDGFILSGGNDIAEAPRRDKLEADCLSYSIKNNIPVLGVCRGMQFMNYTQGGKLIEVQGHVATIHDRLNGIWADQLGIQKVNSFHNYGITDESLGEGLIVLAHTEDGVIEAFKHKDFKWLGIMWHPERNPYAIYNEILIKTHFKR